MPDLTLEGYLLAELAAAGGLAVVLVAIVARQQELARRIDELESASS